MQFQGISAVVIGTKRSGMAAIELLRKAGARVTAMDAQPPDAASAARLAELQVPFEPQAESGLDNAQLIVISPGVPFDLPMLVANRRRGITVMGEVELASHFLAGPVIGITGSNGKTTTTALTGHILQSCGIPSQVGGNIGVAVATLVNTSRPEQWNVLELSSFQLESITQFRANIAACLNVTPDHLDRHQGFGAYAAAKRRLFETQQSADAAVLNYNDGVCRDFAAAGPGDVYWFSSTQPVPRGLHLQNGAILMNGEVVLQRSSIRIRGLHNVENVMAAALMAHLAGASWSGIAAAVESFPGVEHRLEFVREVAGVQYFNDSKATNVDATQKALDAFTEPLWVILGGKDKGGSYKPLLPALREKAKAVLTIGAPPPYPHAAAPLIAAAFKGLVPLVDCGTLEAAVAYAHRHAAPGDVVLLAPACASFDQYQSYEQRGAEYKHFVQIL